MNTAIVRRQSITKMHVQKCTLPPQVKYKFTSTFLPHNNTEIRIHKTVKEFWWCPRTVSTKPMRIYISILFPRLLVYRFKRIIFIVYGNYVSYFTEL